MGSCKRNDAVLDSDSDDEDTWFIGPAHKRHRDLTDYKDNDKDKKFDYRKTGMTPFSKNEKEKGDDDEVDYSSNESNTTEVIGGLQQDPVDEMVLVLSGDQDDIKEQKRSENVDKAVSRIYDPADSDSDADKDDELLSIASSNEVGSLPKDLDSDETYFESSPILSRTLPTRQNKSRPSSSSSILTINKSRRRFDDDKESDCSDTTIFRPTSDSDEDFKLESVINYSDSELSGDEEFKKVSKGKVFKRQRKPMEETSEEDDEPIPKPRRDRFHFPYTWHGVDSDEASDPSSIPVYNPSDVHKESWHGDVQRTVTMLDGTIQNMPMPSDDGNEDIKLPPGLVELYGHQKYGLRWMNWREGQFPGGGILADEMGLGKTIEVIALIMKSKWEADKLRKENVIGKRLIRSCTTLVVCPLSCIPQWCREIETKGKGLSVYTYHGAKKRTTAAKLATYDVVITTYQTIAHEIPKLAETETSAKPRKPCRSPLLRVYWLRIVLDEAHYIRNPKTNAASAIFQLEALYRWAVTGTPIHNRPEDFYSMCTFLRLTPFDDRKVWDFWIGLKRTRRGSGAVQRLHILGKALILRRTKEEVGLSNDSKVKVIPPKAVEIVSVELSNEERQVYDMLMAYAQSILREFLSQKEQREHGMQIGGLMYAADRVQEMRENCPQDIRFSHIFALLVRLRQCAVLPHLIETMLHEDEVGAEEVDLEELKTEHIVSKKNPIFNRLYISSKFQKILDDVDELRSKAEETGQPMDKVIIVSSWTSTLDIIFEHLNNKNYSCVFITGRDNMDIRMESMDRFNKNRHRPQILLLSLMAGGVGLNLVGANHVFFIEPHWNPQHELQAQDRVHRFGQTKNVFIRRYIAEDTIESRIMGLQEQKLELADGLLNNTRKKMGAGITLEQMKHLFDIHNHYHSNDDFY